jgi:hypothetical protein
VDTSNDAPKVIYFDGWRGLGISAVLRAIAEHPPPSLLEKFDKIIHIDCSVWNSRRALQRVITDKLNLTQHVAADFDKQDEEDDFNGVDQSSRAEIGSVARVVTRSLVQYRRCLVVFHNGSDESVDLTGCGIPDPKIFDTKVLWTFRGRFRLISDYVYLYPTGAPYSDLHLSPSDKGFNWNALLMEEAREIALYTRKLGLGVTPETAADCCLYLLSLSRHDYGYSYKWKTHASSHLVCDGIVEGGQDNNQAWELAHALVQHIKIEEWYTYRLLPASPSRFDITKSYFQERKLLPSDWFHHHKACQVRVLKLSDCTFSFSSPPFHCCHNLRFLGLDRCEDNRQLREEEKQTAGAHATEFFQRLWVLDVRYTDYWQLTFPLETEEQEAVDSDIREVHIERGKIWRSNLAWRRLPNLRELRVVEPRKGTRSWETGAKDEFMDMVKLELLDLSRDTNIKVLPSLSGATGLKTLVQDGCLMLKQIGPHGLPPSLESFSLDTTYRTSRGNTQVQSANISHISLAGCTRLLYFTLIGSFPHLEELDLSHTAVKMLDLRKIYIPPSYRVLTIDKGLERIFLMGCEQLRSILWPKRTYSEHQLRLMYIDTRAGAEMARKPSSSQAQGQKCCCGLFLAAADMRFFRSVEFLWWKGKRPGLKVNLCVASSTSKDGGRRSAGQLAAAGSPLPKPSSSYHDVSIEQIATKMVYGGGGSSSSSNASQFEPLDFHMEIGEGALDVPKGVTTRAVCGVMARVQSLHVHDSSSITSVAPEHIFVDKDGTVTTPYVRSYVMQDLKWCRVERCSKLDTYGLPQLL